MRNNMKLGLGFLTVLATPFVVGEVSGNEAQAEYKGQLFYNSNKLANWWHDDGSGWYFFKDGKKYTGWGKDNAGEHYYVNGKYANGQYNGKNYVNGKEKSIKDGYSNNLFYSNNRLANWWYDDGSDWYFFKDGKKYTGWGKDNAGEHYYVNGKYANGQYNGKNYVNGKEESVKEGYSNNLFYSNNRLANWWHDDGSDWYFFKDGKKYTGWGKDNAGEHYYVNGKYANGQYNGKNYVNGKEKSIKDGYSNNLFYSNNRLANWWYDDGSDWYFFKDGKKYTGWGKDNAGEHYYVNGKYANGQYNGKNYVNGKEGNPNGYVNNLFYSNNKLANSWHDDGQDWYFFKDGRKYTGWGIDGNGERYFVNGKYANGQYNGKNYVNGEEKEVNTYSGYYKVVSLYIPVYDASGNILSHVSKDTILFRDNRASVGGRIPVQVAGLTGYVNPSQVQAVNSSTTFIPDYVSDGKYVYHRYSQYSKVMVAYHNANMVVGKSYYSADGINFGTFKLNHPFQFSNLKSKTNYTAADLNRLYSLMGANDSRLAGKGATFKAAEERYGVNALYLVAHSALESAWGRSKIARDKNNFFGISAYDNNPYNAATKFDNVDSGILGAARWINEKYLSKSTYPARGAYLGNKAGGMNVNYATAPYWGESIASIMFAANEKLGRKDG